MTLIAGMIEENKERCTAHLKDLLFARLREDQFTIVETLKGWDVSVSYIPKGFAVPTKISHWDVSLKKLK